MFRSDVKLKAIHSPDISVALRHKRSSIPPANMGMRACIATRNVYRLYVEGQDPYMFALPAAESESLWTVFASEDAVRVYLCLHDPRRAASGTAQGQGVHTVPVGPYMSPRESSCSPRIRLKTAEKGACLGDTSSGVFLKVLQKCDGAQPCATCTSSSRADGMTAELAGLPGGGPIEEGTFAFSYFPAPTEDPVGNNPDFPLDPELFPREMEDFFE
ncbi:hypothetical protein B0H14DRAFT_2614362 [Mycena olivaceomarginata]|nr:hypothetical protein B0H14DRAFT_2614362 [Mycena olivaceomarginata]